MKRFVEQKKNKKIVKEIIQYLTMKYDLVDILNWDLDYYQRDKGALHFTIGEYRFGIWLPQNVIFAEHLGYMDKFRPSASSFSKSINKSILGGYNLPIHHFIIEVLCYGGKVIDQEKYDKNPNENRTDLDEWREYLQEEKDGINRVVLADMDYCQKIKNCDERILSVHFVTWYPKVWTGSRLAIKMNTPVADEERAELIKKIRGICVGILGMEEQNHSKIYQSIFNGWRVDWFVPVER